jgi:PAS domain S-box-containing protein
MNGFGTFGLLSFALQLTVPSYSLRLVRRFGTARVGWFIVTAFSVLALLQLLKPLRAMSPQGPSSTAMDLVVSAAAVLLVVGMGHLETILSAEQAAARGELKVRAECETLAGERHGDLARANEDLLRKIASLEKAEETLRQSEGEYRFLFVENPQPMWIFDLRTLRFLAVNKAALRQYGFTEEEFAALTVRDIVSPGLMTRFQSDAARPCSTAQLRGAWQHYRKDRTPMDVEVTALDLRYGGYPARLVLVSDLSARVEEKKQYFEERRQQVAGQLAGGVAHYLNNILSIISGHASILAHKQPDEQNAEHLAQISNAVNTAAGLSRQLLIASGHFPLTQEMVDLNALLRTMQPTLTRLVGRDIRIQAVFGMEMPRIPADPRLLEHIILNLALNARDAMPCGGTITLRTESVRLGESSFGERALSRTGNFVRLAVRDTGCGLSQEAREHLFEPFFSTRGVGKGRGLGLASIHGAVRQHGGWIEYTSEIDKGTEFSLFFPEIAPALKNTETEFHRRMRC